MNELLSQWDHRQPPEQVWKQGSIPCVGFAGWSGSGKTTLIAKLIPQLKRCAAMHGNENFRVAVIKHDVHGARFSDGEMLRDTEGTDTMCFRRAGADVICLCTPEGIYQSIGAEIENPIFTFIRGDLHRDSDEDSSGLLACARPDRGSDLPSGPALLPAVYESAVSAGAELVLVEGFKNAPVAQVGLRRSEMGKEWTKDPSGFIALVTNTVVKNDNHSAMPPLFCPNDAAGLAEFLFAWGIEDE